MPARFEPPGFLSATDPPSLAKAGATAHEPAALRLRDLTMTFDSLGLPEPLVRAVADAGYASAHRRPDGRHPAGARRRRPDGRRQPPAAARPRRSSCRRCNRVLAARADTTKRREKGTVYGPRILVLTPTRELAMQIAKAAAMYGRHVPGLRVATVVGGVPYPAQLPGAARPARHPDLDARPPARPPADRQGRARERRDAGARRSRSHARHGLHRRHHDDRRPRADRAPDGDVQRHLPRQRRPPRRRTCCAIRSASTSPRTPTPTPTSSSACTGPTTSHHKNALLDHILTQREVEQALGLHEHADRRRPARRPPGRARPRASRRCTAACRRAGATACLQGLRSRSCASWSPPTSPRAASTCRRSATSSTTACR